MNLALERSLPFLAFGLFVCAQAGAVQTKEVKPAAFAPELRVSVYAPKTARNPFLPAGTVVGGAATVAAGVDAKAFNLQGILHDPTAPSAMINNSVVMLNKPVTLQTGSGAITVKAVEITRNSVKLQVGEQIVQLRLELPIPVVPATSPKAQAQQPAAKNQAGGK